MFSSRLNWDLRPNPLTDLLRAKRRAGSSILDLTESNPTAAALSYPREEILEALADPRALLYEPSPAGLHEARAAVAAYYAGRGERVETSRILLTASASEAYSYLLKLLANPGDEILVPQPSYPLFEFLAAMEAVRAVAYPLVYEEGWRMDFDALIAAVTNRTRAVVVVNPNNPTGSFIKRDELERLVVLYRERGLAIISDEVFSDYSFHPDPNRVASLVDVKETLTFCLSGLSKVAGLPQMKLSWIVAGGSASQAFENLEFIADTYLSVAAPVQHALPALLAAGTKVRDQIATRVKQNLAEVQAAMNSKPAFRGLKVEGGWYATIQVPRTRTEEEWVLYLLEDRDVLVQPGYFYDFDREAFLIVSLLTPSGQFAEGVRRIVR